MFCKQCGNEIGNSSRFCRFCGAAQVAEEMRSTEDVLKTVLPVDDKPQSQTVNDGNNGKRKKNTGLIIVIIIIVAAIIVGSVGVLLYFTSDSYNIKKNLKLAKECYNAEEYIDALKYYQEVLRLDDTLAGAYLECANIYIELEEYEKAESILEKGIKKLKKDKDSQEELEKLLEEVREKLQPIALVEEPSTGAQAVNKVVQAVDGQANGDIGTIFRTEFFDYSIDSVTYPFEYEGYTPGDGMQLLDVVVTIENTFGEELPMYNSDFQIQWHDFGNGDYDFAYGIEMDGSRTVMPFEYPLAAGNSCTYHIIYEVPAAAKEFSVSYLELFSDNTQGDVFFTHFTKDSVYH